MKVRRVEVDNCALARIGRGRCRRHLHRSHIHGWELGSCDRGISGRRNVVELVGQVQRQGVARVEPQRGSFDVAVAGGIVKAKMREALHVHGVAHGEPELQHAVLAGKAQRIGNDRTGTRTNGAIRQLRRRAQKRQSHNLYCKCPLGKPTHTRLLVFYPSDSVIRDRPNFAAPT